MLSSGILNLCTYVMPFDNGCCRQNNENELQRKDPTRDKWEMTSNDVTIYEELGHGAFGKVCKGIMQVPSRMKRRQAVNNKSETISKSTITVAVKMLQGMLNYSEIYVDYTVIFRTLVGNIV